MKIAVIGCGYVGLVTGACFSSLGNQVICVDIDARKIAGLRKGKIPIYEPSLEEMVRKGLKAKTLFFTGDLRAAARKSDIIFIAVGTPPRPNGEADLSFIENVTREIAKSALSYKLIVEKSTVPVQTGQKIRQTLEHYSKKGVKFDVASNPEFLREGSAISDFMKPERIILGVESAKAKQILLSLYKPLKASMVVTDIKSAEIIKHASNSFLATKISFINAISIICDAAGADVEQVASGMGLDHRIGKDFLNPGIGFGGFCFPKDLAAFVRISEKLGYNFELLKAVENINENQKKVFVKKIETALWNIQSKKIGVLGLSFKPNTDDIRFAPSLDIIQQLQSLGAKIKAYDPHAMPNARKVLKNVEFCRNSYDVARGSDCLAVLTEWDEFKELDLKRIKKLMGNGLIVDGRNIYDPQVMKQLGFKYISMGRA